MSDVMDFRVIVWILGTLICLPVTFWIFSSPNWWDDVYEADDSVSTIESTHPKTRGEMVLCYIISCVPFFNLIYLYMILDAAGVFNPMKNWLKRPVKSTRID